MDDNQQQPTQQYTVQAQQSSTPQGNPIQQDERIKGTFMEFTPENSKQREAYNTGIISLLYNKDTKGSIYKILQSGDPSVTIPKATYLLNNKMKEAVESSGKQVDLGTQLSGVVFTTMELANLGNNAGFFQLGHDDMPQIAQSSIKEYVHSGLKDGSIDPVEAQEAATSLMTPEQKAQCESIAAQKGFPQQPGVSAAMETYANQKVSKERQKYMQIMNRRIQAQAQQQPQQEQSAINSIQGGAS